MFINIIISFRALRMEYRSNTYISHSDFHNMFVILYWKVIYKGLVTLLKIRVNAWITYKVWVVCDISVICAFHRFYWPGASVVMRWCTTNVICARLYAIQRFEQLKTRLRAQSRIALRSFAPFLLYSCMVCVVLTRIMCETFVGYQRSLIIYICAEQTPVVSITVHSLCNSCVIHAQFIRRSFMIHVRFIHRSFIIHVRLIRRSFVIHTRFMNIFLVIVWYSYPFDQC